MNIARRFNLGVADLIYAMGEPQCHSDIDKNFPIRPTKTRTKSHMKTLLKLTYISGVMAVSIVCLISAGSTALIYAMGESSCRSDRNFRNPICKGSAALGNPVASYFVATDYHFGQYGYDVDIEKAVSEYQYVADRGVADAKHNLGEMLLSGDGVPQDTIGGLKLLIDSAEANNAISLHRLALLLFNPDEESGYFEQSENKQAIELYRRAALRGYTPSVFALGLILFYGISTNEDEERGLILIKQAYDEGYGPAEEFFESFKPSFSS